MRILAFDTADSFCTLVLTGQGKTRAVESVEAGRTQAAVLAPLTEKLLKDKGLAVRDIDRLAICTGPGSFTGLRVGMAFARGLAQATKKPLLGFDHFTCTLAAVGKLSAPLLVLRASGRDELFACLAENEKRESFLATAERAHELLNTQAEMRFTGNAADALLEKFPQLASRHIVIAAQDIVAQAAQLAENTTMLPTHLPDPLYLREADVTLPRAHA